MKLLQIVLLLGVAAPTQVAQKSTSSIQEKLEQVDFTIETATVDNPVAYESGLYRHHAQMEMMFPNALRWDHSPAEIQQLAGDHIKFANDTINAIVKTQGRRTFENTIEPLAKYDHEWNTKTTSIGFYNQVSPSKEIREASKEYDKRIGSFQTDLEMREDFYNAVKDYKAQAEKDGSFAKLDPESQRYVNQRILEFERGGLLLPAAQRTKLIQLQKEVDDLAQLAESNINEDKTTIEMKETDLLGLSKEMISKLKKVPGKEDHRIVPLSKQEVPILMKLLQKDEARKKVDYEKGIQNKEKNVPLIEKLVQKRHEVALMLGYSSYSEMVLEPRMAKTPMLVQQFEDDLTHRISSMGAKEMDRLLKVKRKETKDPKATWHPWDFAYYANIYKKQVYDIDEDNLKEYFPAEHVKEKTLEIYQQLLGLEFKKLPKVATWHKDVAAYEVRDKETNGVLGQFYLDLYPRPDKFNHAAAFTLLKRARVGGKVEGAAVAMVTNFNPPQGDIPALLQHHEVVTFFHEFGHVMHNLCSEANYTRFSGASVERDFVEMPSQMLENWIWDKDLLKKVSKHYKTGKPLSKNLIDAKIRSRNDMVATATLNQIFLGTLDLMLYSAADQKLISAANTTALSETNGVEGINTWRRDVQMKGKYIVDTEKLWHKLAQKIEHSTLQPHTNPIGSFGHIFAGYESQYYSYLWSKVYSCELFQKFKEQGLLDPQIGMKYRKTILAPGGSRDSLESLKLFLGREPNNKAFLHQNAFDKEAPSSAKPKVFSSSK